MWARAVLLSALLSLAAGEKRRVMDDYRVPTAVVPSHYTVKLLTSLADDFNFLGEVWITVSPKTAVDTITLNYKNLDIFENATKIELLPTKAKRDVTSAARRRLALRERNKPIAKAVEDEPEKPATEEKPESSVETSTTPVVTTTVMASTPEIAPQAVMSMNTDKPEEPAVEPSKAEATTSSSTVALEEVVPEKPAEEAIVPPEAAQAKPEENPVEAVKPAENPEEKPMDVKPSEAPELLEQPSEAAPEAPEKPAEVPLVTEKPESPVKPLEMEQPGSPEVSEASTKAPVSESDSDDYLEVVTHDYDTERQFLTLSLSRALQPGEKYDIYIKFQGFLSDNLAGFYRVAYTKKNRKNSWVAATVFEPMDARSAFPCFDEPEYKATFDIILGHSSEYKALSNMPLRTTKLINDKPGWQLDYFETTPRMSTYLVSFLISDFESIDASKTVRNSTDIKIWSRREIVHKAKYAAKIAPKMLQYLEEDLQVVDPLPKYDLVAMPSFISNALENWGLISFSERSLLYSPGLSSLLSKYETTRLIGHELAHSWFGNSITPRWWDQVWMSEGLCNFFETKAADYVQPTWDVITYSAVSSYLRIFTLDGQPSSHALVPPVKHLNDLNDLFDSITYQKGYYLTRMLNHTLGEEAFMTGIRAYVKANQLGLVEEEDMWSALTPPARAKGALPGDATLSQIMRAWTHEPGYPVVKVIRDYTNKTATLTQSRFVRPKEDYELRAKNASDGPEWYIPITYTTGAEMRFADTAPRLWLQPGQREVVIQDIADEKDFVLMNIQAAGMYRVNYDYDNWALLVDALLSDNYTDISVINRVQILDDLLDFARAGEIAYKIALDATSYLRREKHYLPWKAAFTNFEFISRMMRSTDGGKLFKKFMRNLVSDRYDELGFEPKTEESLFESMNRKQIVKWACRTGHKQCVRNSVSMFRKWTNEKKPDEVNPIPTSLRSVVYCTAIEQGGARDWQFLWQRYLSNVIVTDKAAIIAGLGCSRNTRTLSKYLDWSLKETSGVKKQDSVAVFKAVASNDVGYPLAKTFLREKISEVPKYVGVSTNGRHVPQMVDALARKMNKQQDLLELEELERENGLTLRSSPRVMQQAMEKVRFNVGWVQTNLRPISDWLKRKTA